jgi:hypothetical protein
MPDEQDLTPEEKLLRVIQKGDPSPLNAGRVAGEGSVATEADDAAGDPAAIVPELRRGGRGLTLTNRLLASAALFFLLLAGYETYLNMPAAATVYPAEPLEIGARSFEGPAVSLGDTLDMFARRRVFGQPERAVIMPSNTNVVNLIGWRAYARENLTLMGMSDVTSRQDGSEKIVREAIMMDNKVRKMHFLREGSTLIVAEQEVSVSSVGETAVELRRGDEVLKVE